MNRLILIMLLFTLRLTGQDSEPVTGTTTNLHFCIVSIEGKDMLVSTNSRGECHTNRLSSLPVGDLFLHSQTLDGMKLDRSRLLDQFIVDFNAYISARLRAGSREEEKELADAIDQKRRQLQARVRRLSEIISIVE